MMQQSCGALLTPVSWVASAGETQEQMQPVLKRLHDNGIGSILDYAAEVRPRLLALEIMAGACMAVPAQHLPGT